MHGESRFLFGIINVLKEIENQLPMFNLGPNKGSSDSVGDWNFLIFVGLDETRSNLDLDSRVFSEHHLEQLVLADGSSQIGVVGGWA